MQNLIYDLLFYILGVKIRTLCYCEDDDSSNNIYYFANNNNNPQSNENTNSNSNNDSDSEQDSSDSDSEQNSSDLENRDVEELTDNEHNAPDQLMNDMDKVKKAKKGDPEALGELKEEYPEFFNDTTSEQALNDIDEYLEEEFPVELDRSMHEVDALDAKGRHDNQIQKAEDFEKRAERATNSSLKNYNEISGELSREKAKEEKEKESESLAKASRWEEHLDNEIYYSSSEGTPERNEDNNLEMNEEENNNLKRPRPEEEEEKTNKRQKSNNDDDDDDNNSSSGAGPSGPSVPSGPSDPSGPANSGTSNSSVDFGSGGGGILSKIFVMLGSIIEIIPEIINNMNFM